MDTQNKNNATEVAKYLIYLASRKIIGDNGEREGLTNLKLQKILYLAQAFCLSKFNKPLFEDTIEAWTYGPVVPTVYREFKHFGDAPIIQEEDQSELSDEDKSIVEKVWDSFGGYSASKLVDITHSHLPWKEAFASRSKQISNDSLAKYYKPLIGES
jgi:uncharacterized phage-associated protein